jgi:tetratricopeptide (TPR) repeat protein
VRYSIIHCSIIVLTAIIFAAFAFQPDTAMLRRLYEEALARRQREYGVSDGRTAQAARDLGLFLQRAGDNAGARKALAEALRADEKAFGAAAEQTLEDAASLAALSPPADAEPLLRRAAESPDATVAGPALTSWAAIRKAAGDRAGAAALLRRAVAKAEEAGGKDGPIVALILNSLAPLVEPAEAVALLERALAIDRRTLGPREAQTVQCGLGLAAALRRVGRVQEAAGLEREFNGAK